MFVSEYIGIENLEAAGVFDAVMDRDSHFFINILRLKATTVPEFKESYEKVNEFFRGIAKLLAAASVKDTSKDKFFRAAFAKFEFSEVNGINLGFSESERGSGMGAMLRKQVLCDAFDMIKQGTKDPEIFQLVGLFEDNIGPDRLSDMIATIIEDDIKAYTSRVQKEFSISPEKYPNLQFCKSGRIYNPYKKCALLLLPVEILHELPIARSWEDIDRVVSENQAIRDEINEAIGEEWRKWASSDKKQYIRDYIFKNPEKCARVIEDYRQQSIGAYSPYQDIDYFVDKLWYRIKNSGLSFIEKDNSTRDTFTVSKQILDVFKQWVEDNRGWDVIQSADTRKREKIVQRIIHLSALAYIEANKLDISCEPDEGRGPVDFKVSNGEDKTLIEVKLSSNQQYMHGYEVQVEEYGKAEKTEKLIYVLIDVGNPKRVKNLLAVHKKNVKNNNSVPDVVVISAIQKSAASTFDNDEWELDELDFEMPDMDFSMEDLKWSEK